MRSVTSNPGVPASTTKQADAFRTSGVVGACKDGVKKSAIPALDYPCFGPVEHPVVAIGSGATGHGGHI